MTNESILALVDAVNNGSARDRIFIRPLADHVDFGYAWIVEPAGRAANDGSYRMYFIRDDTGTCVGAVEDLGGDIHAVMKLDHRRQGIMSRAMRDVILPHLCSGGRTALRAQLCSPEGRALALGLGFQPIDDGWAEISVSAIRPRAFPPALLVPLSPERLAAVQDRIRAAAACLREAAGRLKSRASPRTFDQLGFAEFYLQRLLDADLELDLTAGDTPPPALPPLDKDAQKDVERRIDQAAGWLRMTADESEGANNPEQVAEIRRLARRIANTAQETRDDWRDRQHQVWLAARTDPPLSREFPGN